VVRIKNAANFDYFIIDGDLVHNDIKLFLLSQLHVDFVDHFRCFIITNKDDDVIVTTMTSNQESYSA
jgi:hypothetical protein